MTWLIDQIGGVQDSKVHFTVLVLRGLEPICEYAASEIEKLRATEFAPNLRTADRFERLARQKGCTT